MEEIEYFKNPFPIKEGAIKECFKRIEGGDYELADTSSGEINVFRKAAKNKRVLVDTSNYVKIYKAAFPVLISLSRMSLITFWYIAENLKPHNDTIYLDCEIVGNECGFKRTAFYGAISELIDKKVIARKTGSSVEFFVNINYVFNGSRLKVR
jgi:hypothetical protein